MFRWIRNYMRARTAYMDPKFAAETKNKITLVYTLIAWNLFGFTVYKLWTEKVPKIHDSVDYAKMLGIKDAKVIRYSNFSRVDEYDIQLSDKELSDFKDVVGTKEELKQYELENQKRIRSA